MTLNSVFEFLKQFSGKILDNGIKISVPVKTQKGAKITHDEAQKKVSEAIREYAEKDRTTGKRLR